MKDSVILHCDFGAFHVKWDLHIPYSTKLWLDKTLANRLFQSFGKENVGEFTIANISYFSNPEFSWVKYWQMMLISPNSSKFSPPKFYTIQ